MANDKFKNWAKLTPDQLKSGPPTPTNHVEAEAALASVGVLNPQALQQEVGTRMAAVLQPMVDRSKTVEEQSFIVGGIVAFAVGVAIQAGMTEADLIAAVKNLAAQIPR